MILSLLLLACPEHVDSDTAPVVYVEGVSSAIHEEIASLVEVSWTQVEPASVRVEYRFEEGEWLSTPESLREPGAADVLLLGVPYATAVDFRVVVGGVPGETLQAETGPLPSEALVPEVRLEEDYDPERWDPAGRYLLMSMNEIPGGWTQGVFWTLILDRSGRVVWARKTPHLRWTIYTQVSASGEDLLVDEFTFWSDWDNGAASVVHRMKIDGSIAQTIPTPGAHHAFVELPDGSIAWGAAEGWTQEQLRVRGPGGGMRTLWRCRDWQRNGGVPGYCQSNALYYHPDTDVFLYSMYTSSTVVEVDATTGETLREWGHAPRAWAFEPVESAFWWQHGVSFTDAGTLLLSTHADALVDEGVVREYALDEARDTLVQVWSYGEDEGVDAQTAGEAHRLPSGNTLHNYGSGSRIKEITPEGEVVWDVAWEENRLLGRSVWVEDLYAFHP